MSLVDVDIVRERARASSRVCADETNRRESSTCLAQK